MARERMVTRTVSVSDYKAIVMDMTDMTNIETREQWFTITGENLDSAKALKIIQKANDTDTFKVVAIVSKYSYEKMFGMPESDFIMFAKELDPETRKVLDTEKSENPET